MNAVLLTADAQGRVAAGREQGQSSNDEATLRARLRLLR